MATFSEQISANVDRLISEGVIGAEYKDEYIKMFTNKPETAERFASVLSMDKDYTRKRQQDAEWRRTEESKVAAERAEVAAQQAALKQWEAEVKVEMERLRSVEHQSPQIQAQLAAYKQKLADYNLLDETVVTPPVQPTIQSKQETTMTQQTQQLPADYLKRDDAASAIRDLMIMQGNLQAIAGEHYALYGKPLTDNLMQEAMQAGVQDIRHYWESKYNVAGKRAEVQQAQYNAELERVRADERAKVMAEITSDPSRVTGGQTFGAPQPSPLFDTYASRGVAAAVDGSVRPLSELSPEMRPTSQATQARVDRALASYAQNYNPDGSPRLGGGPAQ